MPERLKKVQGQIDALVAEIAHAHARLESKVAYLVKIQRDVEADESSAPTEEPLVLEVAEEPEPEPKPKKRKSIVQKVKDTVKRKKKKK